jgi:hypothetical protein
MISVFTKDLFIIKIFLHSQKYLSSVSVTDFEDRVPDNVSNGKYVRFEVFTVVTMKNAFLRDVTPCDFCKNRRFGGT